MTYKFGTQKKQNTSFQKRGSVFSFLKTRILHHLYKEWPSINKENIYTKNFVVFVVFSYYNYRKDICIIGVVCYIEVFVKKLCSYHQPHNGNQLRHLFVFNSLFGGETRL